MKKWGADKKVATKRTGHRTRDHNGVEVRGRD